MIHEPPNVSRGTKIRSVTALLRITCVGLLFGAIGFTVALSTSSTPSALEASTSRDTAGSSGVGRLLRFLNPFFSTNTFSGTNPNLPSSDPLYPIGGDISEDPDGFDLGDAAAGQSLTRYINATGGMSPYSYVLVPYLSTSGPFGTLSRSPTLSNAGKLITTLPTGVSGALRFDITLNEGSSQQEARVGRFKINMLPSPAFTFAQSLLPTGIQGDTYHTNLETVGGVAPVSYTVTSVSLGGVNRSHLEDLGLTLTTDGVLYGRPLATGTLLLTVKATDATGAVATARVGTTPTHGFPIESNTKVNTEITAITLQMKGNQNTPLSDSLSYSGLVNLQGDTLAELAGAPISIRVGSTLFSGNLDAKGKLVETTTPATAASKKTQKNFDLSISSSGLLRIKINQATLLSALNAPNPLTDKTPQNVFLFLEVGRLRSAEVLQITTHVRGGKYALSYRLGQRSDSHGGAFQIITMQGSDGQLDGVEGDRWKIRFLSLPRAIDGHKPIDIFGKSGSATVRIGSGFSQTVSMALKSVRQSFKATFKDEGVYELLFDPKSCVHLLQTNVISTESTGIPLANATLIDEFAVHARTKEPKKSKPQPDPDAPPSAVFPFGIDFNGFSGDTGRVIIRNQRFWRQR